MIEEYLESQNYLFSEREESNYISNINNLLKNLENLLKLNSEEMNHTKIIESSLISESMLKLLLKKKGFLFKSKAPFDDILDFSATKNIIPNECDKFLQIILKYRNESINGIETSNKLTSSFLNAFEYYIKWFDRTYPANRKFKIKGCCEIIDSKYTPDNSDKVFKSIETSAEKYSITQNNCIRCGFIIEDDDNFCPNCGIKIERKSYISGIKQDMILEQLAKQNESLIQILETVLETNDIVKGIDEKINLIISRLDQIQSHTEKLLNASWSDEESDRIIQAHTNESVECILEHENDITNDDSYEFFRKDLTESFEESWRKLTEKSKTFLITSKLMFNKMIALDGTVDYSGICILATKALEVEIHRRFFTDFINYLYEKYGEDYSQYPTELLFKNGKPLNPEKFTMGNITPLLQPFRDWKITFAEKENNKQKLMEYCRSEVFSKYDDEDIEEMLESYASSIDDIKLKYRNPSAHRNQIECIDAKECIDLIIDVEKLLKRMLDSFDK